MSFLSNASRWRLIVLAVLAFTLGSTSLALGLVVNGVITACYQNTSGALRVETTIARCLPFVETRLSWNQTGPQGPTGANGSAGSTGAPGPAGATGPGGVSGHEIVTGAGHIDNETRTISATCPSGKKVLGGGFAKAGTVTITQSARQSGPATSWIVTGTNGFTDAGDFHAYAICVNVN